VADPGVWLGGGGGRKALKVLTVEVKAIFGVIFAIFLLKVGLKLIASEEKIEKILRFGHKKS